MPFQSELRNPVSVIYGDNPEVKHVGDVTANGYIYDKKPFKVSVRKYHVYDWCGCGLSKQQPFCDGTHNSKYIKKWVTGGPVRYIAPEDNDIWFCNCKQTKNRPFCDGSHRSDEVKQSRPDGKFDIWEPRVKQDALE